MTEADTRVQALAGRIADQGRGALVDRLRKAYTDAVTAHADIISLDDQRIEAMVQAAADRADGLQWRRALAEVAASELGVSLPEALSHPAVARAQELVGAPSYEASLAELIARPVPPVPIVDVDAQAVAPPEATVEAVDSDNVIPGQEELFPSGEPAPSYAPADHNLEAVDADDELIELLPEPVVNDPEDASAAFLEDGTVIEEDDPPPFLQPEPVVEYPELGGATDELEAVEADDQMVELLPPPEPIEYDLDGTGDVPFSDPAEPSVLDRADASMPDSDPAESDGDVYGSEHVDYPPSDDHELRVGAYHLGGVANLPAGRHGIGLRLSESGLDILQREGQIIGRLHWNEIDALEVNAVRGRLRRNARTQSRIVVRTKHGDASFEVPGFTSDELQERVDPLVSRYSGAGLQSER